MLHETRRTTDPIEHKWIVFTKIDVPVEQPSVQPYFNRIQGTMNEDSRERFMFAESERGFPTAAKLMSRFSLRSPSLA